MIFHEASQKNLRASTRHTRDEMSPQILGIAYGKLGTLGLTLLAHKSSETIHWMVGWLFYEPWTWWGVWQNRNKMYYMYREELWGHLAIAGVEFSWSFLRSTIDWNLVAILVWQTLWWLPLTIETNSSQIQLIGQDSRSSPSSVRGWRFMDNLFTRLPFLGLNRLKAS